MDRFIQANVSGEKTILLSERSENQEIVLSNSIDIELVNVSCIASAMFYNNLEPGEPIADIDVKQDKLSVIYIYFPLGNGDAYLTTIELARKMRCYAPYNWGVEQAEDENYGVYFKLYPLSDYDLDAREKLYVSISELVTFGKLEKMVYVAVRFTNIPMSDEGNGEGLRSGTMRNSSDEPSPLDTDYLAYFKTRSPLSIMSFTCNRSQVAVGDRVQLSWTIVGQATQCILTPGDIQVGKIGSIALDVTSDTTFRLYAIGESQQTSRTAIVYVVNPEIISFTDDCIEHRTKYGQPVLLSYQIKNSYSAYLNQGIGRLSANTISVTPKMAKTTYTLSCLGRSGLIQQSITLIVTDYLQVNWVIFSRSRNNDGTYSYFINWDVENCIKITLTTSDSILRSSDQASGTTTFSSSIADLKLHLHCIGTGDQVIEQSYDYD